MDLDILANTSAICPGPSLRVVRGWMFDKSSRFRKYEEFIIVAYVRWLGTIRGQRAKSLKIFKLKVLHNLICKERSKVLCSKTAEIQRGSIRRIWKPVQPPKPPYLEQTLPSNVSMIRHGECALVYCTFEKYKQYGVCDPMVPEFGVLWSSNSGIQSWLFVVLNG